MFDDASVASRRFSEKLNVAVTTDTKLDLDEVANSHGVKVSAVIRKCIVDAMPGMLREVRRNRNRRAS